VTDYFFDAPGILHMLFEVTGGSAKPDFGGAGAVGGLRIAFGSPLNTLNDFGSAFSVNLTGTGSTIDIQGVVPEPATYWVWGGLIACALAFNAGWHKRFTSIAA
jgi:hypothetical protein